MLTLKRKDIMYYCPEEFEDKLKDFIDEVEGYIKDAKEKLNSIKSISDLDNIEVCNDILCSLSEDLY